MGIKIIACNLLGRKFHAKIDWVLKQLLTTRYDIFLFINLTNESVLCMSQELSRIGYHYKVSNEYREQFELIATRWSITDWKYSRFSTSKVHNGLFWVESKQCVFAITTLDPTLEKDQLKCATRFLTGKKCVLYVSTGEYQCTPIAPWVSAWEYDGKDSFKKMHNFILHTFSQRTYELFDDTIQLVISEQ